MGLLFTIIFVTIVASITSADMIKCRKKDECSCITDTQQIMSLWKLKNNMMIRNLLSDWLYAVDLCHGVKMTYHVNNTEFGCKNATACRYKKKQGKVTTPEELGHYGSAVFGDYDNSTNTTTVFYRESQNNKTSLSINITLICDENVNGSYEHFKQNVLEPSKYTGTITTKAACLKPYHKHDKNVVKDNKPTPVYVIVIVVAGSMLFISVIVLVVYRVKKNRENSAANIQQNTENTPLLI